MLILLFTIHYLLFTAVLLAPCGYMNIRHKHLSYISIRGLSVKRP